MCGALHPVEGALGPGWKGCTKFSVFSPNLQEVMPNQASKTPKRPAWGGEIWSRFCTVLTLLLLGGLRSLVQLVVCSVCSFGDRDRKVFRGARDNKRTPSQGSSSWSWKAALEVACVFQNFQNRWKLRKPRKPELSFQVTPARTTAKKRFRSPEIKSTRQREELWASMCEIESRC